MSDIGRPYCNACRRFVNLEDIEEAAKRSAKTSPPQPFGLGYSIVNEDPLLVHKSHEIIWVKLPPEFDGLTNDQLNTLLQIASKLCQCVKK